MRENVADLLKNMPLYKKVAVEFNEFTLSNLEQIKFSSMCTIENSIQTFELTFQGGFYQQKINDGLYIDWNYEFNKDLNKENCYHSTRHYQARCLSCNLKTIDYLLTIYTTGPIRRSNGGIGINTQNNNPQIIIEKTGQNPMFHFEVDRDVSKFIDTNNLIYYKKAISCLSYNYGIGAYVYFRRIIESEIIRILEFIGELEIPDSSKIKEILRQHKTKNNTAELIKELNPYLPADLIELGSNPITVLYSITSEGIHKLTEEHCYDMAFEINNLLLFVIKKLFYFKSEFLEAKKSLLKIQSLNLDSSEP